MVFSTVYLDTDKKNINAPRHAGAIYNVTFPNDGF